MAGEADDEGVAASFLAAVAYRDQSSGREHLDSR
jgi:hypothetical protein